MTVRVKVFATGGGGDPLAGKVLLGGVARATTLRGDVNWPAGCVCCGAPTENTTKMDASQTRHSAWSNTRTSVSTSFLVPCCARCAKHWNAFSRWTRGLGLIAAIPLCVFVYYAGALGYRSVDKTNGGGWAILVALLAALAALCAFIFLSNKITFGVAAAISRDSFTPSCSTKRLPVRCVRIDLSNNSYEFEFANEQYAQTFREANPWRLNAAMGSPEL